MQFRIPKKREIPRMGSETENWPVPKGRNLGDAPSACQTTNRSGRSWRRRLAPAFLWLLFGAGLLVQALSPGLKIADNAFVIPPSLVAEGGEVHPAEIIERERRFKLLSAILTGSGALGLAFYYRRVFVRPSEA